MLSDNNATIYVFFKQNIAILSVIGLFWSSVNNICDPGPQNQSYIAGVYL